MIKEVIEQVKTYMPLCDMCNRGIARDGAGIGEFCLTFGSMAEALSAIKERKWFYNSDIVLCQKCQAKIISDWRPE